VCENYAAIRCPVLAVGGWADGYPNAVLRLLEHLPGTRRGIVGPWAHAWPHAARPGPRIGFLQECVRWWGQWLRDESNGVTDAPLLRAWIEAPSAAVAADRVGAWYGGGLPVEEARFGLPAQRVVADLAHGRAAGEWCPFGSHETAADQRDDDAASTCVDLPVETDLVLLGRARLHFRATDRLRGGHVVVRLCDVDPGGASSLVAWGVAAVRTGRVDLKAAGRRVPRGHRLRVALARTYWPVLWPARDIETLDVADLALVLPLASAASATVTFDAAEAAPAGACDVLRPGRFVRKTADRVAVRLLDGGRVRHGNGIVVESESEDRLTLGDDAASAAVECRRRISLARDAWRVDVRVEASMRSDGDAFTVDVRLEAEEPGHTPPAPRRWRARLPRPPE